MSFFTSLSCYYKLDGNSIRSFGSNNGTDTSVSYVTGIHGQAASFGGSGYILIPHSADVTLGSGDWSISIWVKRAAINARHLFFGDSHLTGSGSSLSIAMEFAANNVINVYWNLTGGSASAWNVGTEANTNWHHYVIQRNGTALEFYRDGSYVNSLTIGSTAMNTVTNNFALGRSGDLGLFNLNGLVDEFGLWKRKLTSTEVTTLYNSGLSKSYPFTKPTGFFKLTR